CHEHQQERAMSVSLRNIITSMRLTSAFDWQEFFENVSLVDEILRKGTHFAEMDFATRDKYRHAIEDLSWGSGYSEIEVAKRAVNAAERTRSESVGGALPHKERHAEPGYY